MTQKAPPPKTDGKPSEHHQAQAQKQALTATQQEQI